MEHKLEVFYIDDCLDAVLKLFHSNFSDPINIGSDEKVTINQLLELQKISQGKISKKLPARQTSRRQRKI